MNLAPEDAKWLIQETTTDQTVLIGGQAVAFWAAYFSISPRIPALTADIDYLGTKASAKRVAERLKVPHKLSVATLGDATPNAAVIEVALKGYPEPIIIDYLAGIIGIVPGKIQKAAATVEIDGTPLRVMHPLQLLQSKTWNLYRLSEKRTPEGIEQARLSIEIASAYVDEAATDSRRLLDDVEMIGKFAATEPSRFVRENYQLECLNAIPSRAFEKDVLPGIFHEKRWPQILKANAGYLAGPGR